MNLDFSSIRKLVDRVFIGKLNCGRFIELTFEIYIEINQLAFENIRKRFRIRNDALNNFFIVFEFHFTDDRRKRISQELNYFLRGILRIVNEHMMAFTAFSTA
jgi:hypothetical protein